MGRRPQLSLSSRLLWPAFRAGGEARRIKTTDDISLDSYSNYIRNRDGRCHTWPSRPGQPSFLFLSSGRSSFPFLWAPIKKKERRKAGPAWGGPSSSLLSVQCLSTWDITRTDSISEEEERDVDDEEGSQRPEGPALFYQHLIKEKWKKESWAWRAQVVLSFFIHFSFFFNKRVGTRESQSWSCRTRPEGRWDSLLHAY